ncbi:Lrp/AsnC family transcriptional regulator [Desulforamulus ruminis]|uniref:Lrp/AsnC family transcriptional regulator n=1 Tax=Desulforamulus ruminis TaxID=1564 RepID=UPI002357F7B6|nr:Lrp/AsnC family transcriptional regulator [Desulforamulus ruminis]
MVHIILIPKNYNLDSLDYKALYKLMHQGRITWSDLGAYLELSAPAAAERVRRLEERGVIKGYSVLVEPHAVGCEVTAFIHITLNKPENRNLFLSKIQQLPEIQECHHVAGEEDYLLKVRCKHMRRLESIISEEIKGLPGIQKTKTTIVLSTSKETPLLPVCSIESKIE